MLNGEPITYSLFPDEYARTCERRSAAWGDLLSEVERPKHYATKGEMPFIKLATFGDVRSKGHSLRHDANMVDGSEDRRRAGAGFGAAGEHRDGLTTAGRQHIAHREHQSRRQDGCHQRCIAD